jgi:hypothetical protein
MGFSPWDMLFATLSAKTDFFRSLFSRAANLFCNSRGFSP